MKCVRIDRTGEVRVMNNGMTAEIIKYNTRSDIDVRFVGTDIVLKGLNYSNFTSGKIAINGRKQQTGKLVYGFGICDELSAYKRKQFKSYKTWIHMLERCYDIDKQNKFPTYKECSVCDEWKYYSNFKRWYDANYYEVEGEKMCLDKDILVKGNKIYSPDTCIFAPFKINLLFSGSKTNNLPRGINYAKNNKFIVGVTVNNIRTTRRANTLDEAFNIYKTYKELRIKEIADEYKDKIPQKLYDALYKWEVEIDD